MQSTAPERYRQHSSTLICTLSKNAVIKLANFSDNFVKFAQWTLLLSLPLYLVMCFTARPTSSLISISLLIHLFMHFVLIGIRTEMQSLQRKLTLY